MDPLDIIFIFTAVFGIAIYVFLVYNFNYWKKRGVDGLKPRILLGNLPSAITQSRNMIYDVDSIYREFKTKERFAGYFNVRIPQLLIIDPKLCEEILITNFKHFHDNEMARMIDKDTDPLLAGPFFLRGSEWKEKRAEVTPALTTNRVKASYPVMLETCKKMTKYLEQEVRNIAESGVDAKDLAAKFTTEVVANCIYGVEAGAFSSGPCKIREMGGRLMAPSFLNMLCFMVASAVPKLLDFYKIQWVKKDIADFFTKLMEEAVQLRNETKSDRVDFLNYLLQLQEKKNLSSVDMAAHTMTFFLDGFETSSIVISNCLHLLAENPSVQEKLRDELQAARSGDGEIEYEKLIELPFLDQCFNETLRLRPPLLFSTKLCTEPFEVRTSKDKVVQIEKDVVVALPYYSFHHDPEYYPNPEIFDPERFSSENGGAKKYKDMGVFLPFGNGPRICLGMRFGLCQSKAAIAEIIRNWEVSLNAKTKSEFSVDPKQFFCVPDGGTWLNFKLIAN